MNPPALREPRDDAKAPAKKKRTRKAKSAEARVTPTPDPVMELVARLPAIYADMERYEMAEMGEDETSDHPHRSERFYELALATEGVIARTLATSIVGALAQIALAHHIAHKIRDVKMSEDDLTERATDVRWLLYSAVPVIEAATGVRLPDVSRAWHMLDQHCLFREAKKRGPSPDRVSATVATDTALMALAAEFHTAYGDARAAHDKWIGEQERVEALPDCPPFVIPAEDREAHDRHHNFLGEHGVRALADRSTELWRNAGALANAVFASPARTVAEAVEKLKIAVWARRVGYSLVLGSIGAFALGGWLAISALEKAAWDASAPTVGLKQGC